MTVDHRAYEGDSHRVEVDGNLYVPWTDANNAWVDEVRRLTTGVYTVRFPAGTRIVSPSGGERFLVFPDFRWLTPGTLEDLADAYLEEIGGDGGGIRRVSIEYHDLIAWRDERRKKE